MFVGVGVYQTRLFLGDSVVVERNSEQNEEMRERGGEEEEGYRKVAVDSWCNSNKAIHPTPLSLDSSPKREFLLVSM